MRVQRLGWAGIEIAAAGQRLLIDPMDNAEPFKDFLGPPKWPMFRIPSWDGATTTHALVTHRHPDHFDPAALHRALSPNGNVYCPAEIASEVEAAGFAARAMSTWDSAHPPGCDAVTIHGVPAVDWRGDAQLSWVVEHAGSRIFHGGDTIWHGSWWNIAKRFPEFDAAFLPVNGVIARLEGVAPSNLPATLTPDQAAVAARLLNARVFCPIHYGQFDKPGTYRQHADIDQALATAAAREKVSLHQAADGETVLG